MNDLKKEILHCAVGLLARREHSAKELMQKLMLREFEPTDISPVVDYLILKNYLSDERFAESSLRHRANKGFGWRYIKGQLTQKGVCSTIIQNLHKSHEIDWYLQAELAYNKRFGDSIIKDQKDKAKKIRFLQYRGFSHEEIMAVIETIGSNDSCY